MVKRTPWLLKSHPESDQKSSVPILNLVKILAVIVEKKIGLPGLLFSCPTFQRSNGSCFYWIIILTIIELMFCWNIVKGCGTVLLFQHRNGIFEDLQHSVPTCSNVFQQKMNVPTESMSGYSIDY